MNDSKAIAADSGSKKQIRTARELLGAQFSAVGFLADGWAALKERLENAGKSRGGRLPRKTLLVANLPLPSGPLTVRYNDGSHLEQLQRTAVTSGWHQVQLFLVDGAEYEVVPQAGKQNGASEQAGPTACCATSA